jgi:hypothetical protein
MLSPVEPEYEEGRGKLVYFIDPEGGKLLPLMYYCPEIDTAHSFPRGHDIPN